VVLILEVVGPEAVQLGSACRKTFDVEGGLIGRDSRNNWVLPHTKVSGRHASVSYQNGIFYIEDTSTNGVFINASKNRVGKGRSYPLKSGDSIFIDPYTITVTVTSGAYQEPYGRPAAPARPQPPLDPFQLDDPFAEQDVPFGDRIVSSPQDPDAEPLSGHEVDPLKLLGGQEPARRPVARTPPRAQDLERGSPLQGHYQPPRVLTPTPPPEPAPEPPPPGDPFAIPADYDPLAPATKYRVQAPAPPRQKPPTPPPSPPADAPEPTPFDLDDLDLPASSDRGPVPPTAERQVESPPRPMTPAPAQPAPATPPPLTPVPVPVDEPPPIATPVPAAVAPPPAPAERAPVTAAADAGLTIDLRAVLEGAGLDADDVTPELARNFGQILRVVVDGIMEVLQARHSVKDEFRMRVTQFRPVDNNPLKFSANVDDALHNLLVKRNPAYLKPVDAFEDAFDDLRHHQLAMLAGMRTAFEAMLNELHPDRLQEQFDRQLKRGALLGVTAKLRYWDLFRDLHEELIKDPEATFRRLFGDAFAKAYEEQLQRLKAQSAHPASRGPRDEPDI
jgi:type VI secretion system FHA domain protein